MRELLHVAVAIPQVAHGLLLRLLRCAGHHVAGVQPALLARGILRDTQRSSQDGTAHRAMLETLPNPSRLSVR